MKQTAVEWLVEQLFKTNNNTNDVKKMDSKSIIEQAKEMEEEQKGYSEKEVKRLAFDFYYDMSHKMGVPTNLISENATNVDVWFKQFKNK